MERQWAGRLYFGGSRLLYAGGVGTTGLHAHHAFQIVLAAAPGVRLADEGGREHVARAFVIPPDAPHAIVRPAVVAMLYVDPDDAVGRRLRRALADAAPPTWASAAAPLASLAFDAAPTSAGAARRLEEAILQRLVGESTLPVVLHPAVRRALRLIDEAGDEDVTLSPLAEQVRLSASRLSHAFADEVGISLRRYLLWRRMRRTAAHLQRGATLTDAAHAAGFTDSAHMNHAFRRMFGLAPSDVIGVAEWVVLPGTR